jgi:hypothetical protein
MSAPAPRRRWFRVSLRTLFVVVTVAAPLTLLGVMAYERLKPKPAPAPNFNAALDIPFRQNTFGPDKRGAGPRRGQFFRGQIIQDERLR